MLFCFLRNCKEKCTPVTTKWKNQNNFGVLFQKMWNVTQEKPEHLVRKFFFYILL